HAEVRQLEPPVVDAPRPVGCEAELRVEALRPGVVLRHPQARWRVAEQRLDERPGQARPVPARLDVERGQLPLPHRLRGRAGARRRRGRRGCPTGRGPPGRRPRRPRACRASVTATTASLPTRYLQPVVSLTQTPPSQEEPVPEAVIVAATRSPIGRARKGSLKDVRPDDLAAQTIRAALDQVPQLDPTTIDDLQLGCAIPEGYQGGNLARTVTAKLGLDAVPGATVTRFCASSVQTTRAAFHAIVSGEARAVLSAGVESISLSTGKLQEEDTRDPQFRAAWERTEKRATREIPAPWHDPREDGDLPDAYIAMGQTAENVAELRGVTRQVQDEFAVRSQNRAEAAQASGFFAREITPITLPDGTVVDTDDSPRAGVTYEAVAALDPVFRPGGTVTAGN